ncbi:Gfo/Idh/MocA family protein [Ornithinibacillus halotolerans]|uniref:Oxidoreductase n=1 Tax=Ornithinibacillus halotolerans TaxID=1274357 RepID=A0A916RYR5_9BACI|nr:Gfo/Idh/MocA family oxidoreductase [Ornithinibacillus halotolerans]GGA75975.1 oxidoreductase [Ornithinibacillus halotolerans]
MTITIGLIGCGYIARKHLNSISIVKDMKLTAVSDLDSCRMIDAVQIYSQLSGIQQPEVKLYTDYEALLLDKTIDVVVIATSSNAHAQIAMRALAHDKHVILEKPFALSTRDAVQLIERSISCNKHVLVCHQLRYRPVFQLLKKVIDEGLLGELYYGVVSIRIHRPKKYYSESNWKGTWDKDGGMLLNQGIHVIDLLVWYMGEIKAVYGNISNKLDIKETEDVALGILTFDNQATGIVEANTITQPNNIGYSISIFGEKGTISIEGPNLNEIQRCYIPNSNYNNKLDEILEDHNEHVYMYQNFIKVLNKEEMLYTDIKEVYPTLMTIFGIYRSSALTKRINLPLETFSTMEMKEEKNDS